MKAINKRNQEMEQIKRGEEPDWESHIEMIKCFNCEQVVGKLATFCRFLAKLKTSFHTEVI